MIKGQYGKRTKWSMAEMTEGLTGEGPFGKRTKWSMAELIKDQMYRTNWQRTKWERTKWHDTILL